MKRALKRILLAAGLMAVCAASFAVFDPVNDDTDLFRNNPNFPGSRPNVLIILDNSANWSSGGKFTAEKTALINTVAALDSSFNVGMMNFTQGGGCASGSTNGGYLKFGIRQLTTANKAALTSIVNGYTDASCGAGGDQGSAAAAGQSLHEAYLYFSGLASRSGKLQTKRDYGGSTVNTVVANLPPNPFDDINSTTYNSPITDVCAKSYIIFISNGPFDNGDDGNNAAGGLFAGATGLVPNASAGAFSSWADEYADYLYHTGVTVHSSNAAVNGSNAKIIMYAVEVDPDGVHNQGIAHTNLLNSMANRGGGTYFGITSANAGVAITNALLAIFTEIQAVNSVFAASTLPVSVNVRGTNLNQLYIGVFRPDATDRPRWLGNLKAYQLQRVTLNNVETVRTVDSLLNPAINNSTGFINSSAKSFWTDPAKPNATYWGFRTADLNGVGGSSDSPDGDLVEKGGAAQQLRALYFSQGINGSPSRNLYTCTQGTFGTCNTVYSVSPSLLSATPFSVANTDIDAVALSLDSRAVTPLTAKVTQTVSALADTRALSLSNSTGGGASGTLTVTNSTAVAVNLANSTSVQILSMSNGAQTLTTGTCKKSANNVAKVVFPAAHGIASGSTVIVGVPTDSSSKFITSGSIITVSSPTTEFTYPASGLGNPADIACTVTTSNTTTTVTTTTDGTTAGPHGFTGSPTVTITGPTPAQFAGSKAITVTGVNTFTFTNTVSTGPVLATPASSNTVTGSSATVTATKSSGTFTGGTFSAGQFVTIAATPTTYNGTYQILTSPTTSTFTFSTGTAITTAASSVTATQTASTATVATTLPHGFINGQTITIGGATPIGYNGPYVITCTVAPSCVGSTSFTFTPGAGLGAVTANAVTAGSGTGTTVTGTLTNHGFTGGETITIAGTTGANHNGSSFVVDSAPVPTTNTFTYQNAAGNTVAPGGSPTVRLTSSPKAYATITGHGYGAAGASVSNFSITGATPGGYNVSGVTATVVDTNTVSYTLTSALGTNTGATVQASTFGTTATATSTAHGYIAGATVSISGASPSAFNGTFVVQTVPSVDSFTYTLATAQGDATGTITVTSSGGTTSERDNVINWVRGEDNFEDENRNSSFADTRASMHGDVLHSRPSVVNYNRRSTDTANVDNDVYIFYGGNDGIFRAIKGGFGSSTTATFPALAANDPNPGEEVWGFVAKDHFPTLKRLRLNSPSISNSYKKPYFFDGPIGAYTVDANGDGMLDPNNARNNTTGVISAAATGDKVWLFLTMRRGGRAIYALDVGDPLVPKLLWRKGCPSYSTVAADKDPVTGCDLGWSELGQTWSEPKVVSINCTSAPCGTADPVLIFGAGYDPLVEDPDPATVTSIAAASVVSSSTTITRSMGRGLFVVNAATGALIFHASSKAPGSVSMPTGAIYKQISGMDYAIPSDVAVVIGDPGGRPFRAYVGDTGGQMWRFDFRDTNPANWAVRKLASIADQTTTAVVGGATVIPGNRKFQFAPDVIAGSGFDMVLAGTGDREHPFDSIVVNRVYAFKDKAQAADPSTLNQPTIVHGTTVTFNGSTIKSLLDVSTQCIEIAGQCSGTAPEIVVGTTSASANTSNALANSTNLGWFITLAAGEKQVGSTLASGAGVIQFGTNQPSATANLVNGVCSPNLGVARQYAVNFLDGTAFNGTALSTQYVGGGFLPSPVLVFVQLGGATGTGTNSAATGIGVGGAVSGGQLKVGAGGSTGGSGSASAVVCYGASCSPAPGTVLFSRLRKFWYKEID